MCNPPSNRGRTLREHNPEEYARRFWSRVAIGGPDECWEWQGAYFITPNRDGKRYGRINSGGRFLKAHREAYRLHHGELPDDAFICHTCNNPACVNPAHLYAGDAASNVKDMYSSGRQVVEKGTARYNAKLDPEKVRRIRALHEQGVSNNAIARRFDINTGTVSRIVRRLRWKHVE